MAKYSLLGPSSAGAAASVGSLSDTVRCTVRQMHRWWRRVALSGVAKHRPGTIPTCPPAVQVIEIVKGKDGVSKVNVLPEGHRLLLDEDEEQDMMEL